MRERSWTILKKITGNILPESNAAPGIQANQKSLEKNMRADNLDQKLQRRPTAEQLVKEGILEQNETPGQ